MTCLLGSSTVHLLCHNFNPRICTNSYTGETPWLLCILLGTGMKQARYEHMLLKKTNQPTKEIYWRFLNGPYFLKIINLFFKISCLLKNKLKQILWWMSSCELYPWIMGQCNCKWISWSTGNCTLKFSTILLLISLSVLVLFPLEKGAKQLSFHSKITLVQNFKCPSSTGNIEWKPSRMRPLAPVGCSGSSFKLSDSFHTCTEVH